MASPCRPNSTRTSGAARGEDFLPDVAPGEFQATSTVPANDWRGEVRVSWWQGGLIPPTPLDWLDLRKIGHGAMCKGSKDVIVADFDRRIIIPSGRDLDMTPSKSRSKDDLIPPPEHFQQEWIDA